MRRNKNPLNRRQRHAIAVWEAGSKRNRTSWVSGLISGLSNLAKLSLSAGLKTGEIFIVGTSHVNPYRSQMFRTHRPVSDTVLSDRDITDQYVTPVFSAKAINDRVSTEELMAYAQQELMRDIPLVKVKVNPALSGRKENHEAS